MNEEYVFPIDNWYLKIDDENRGIVNNWRINIIKSFTGARGPDIYVNWTGRGDGAWRGSG